MPQPNQGDAPPVPIPPAPPVLSLYDAMQDGNEYASLVSQKPGQPINLNDDLVRALRDIEAIRQRPLICYAGNIVRSAGGSTSIEIGDDVPFSEMLDKIAPDQKGIDIMLASPGGSGQQVHSFVSKMRPRFDDVAFLIPHMAMSAATIWALSGNDLIMDERGFLGPIDPQVPNREGQWVPAQSIFVLIKKIQEEGADSLKQGIQPAWTNLQILKNIDAKEIGNAISATNYAVQLASNYLVTYKFRGWMKNGAPVSQPDKERVARQIADQLSSHDSWKTHSHGIFRDALVAQCKLKFTPVESIPGLQRALRRLWALFYWSFEQTDIQKTFLSEKHVMFRIRQK